jgi:hypothetical protein
MRGGDEELGGMVSGWNHTRRTVRKWRTLRRNGGDGSVERQDVLGLFAPESLVGTAFDELWKRGFRRLLLMVVDVPELKSLLVESRFWPAARIACYPSTER